MEGRVVGGMGALPGFGWWPIKAYKPCPALFEAGLEYERWAGAGVPLPCPAPPPHPTPGQGQGVCVGCWWWR